MLAVVLYHAGLGGAGFLGVDVFFVISGYLITALLLREHQFEGAIDLRAFYARRVRRIVPAAALVIALTSLLCLLLLPPAPISQALGSAAAALVFAANFYFEAFSGGYFDGRSEEMPLLHLWSLSVEEQFYLFWPALLMVVLRYRSAWLLPVLCGLGGASLAIAVLLLHGHPEAVFFQMPARFWELAAGGIIAASPPRPLPRVAGYAGIAVTLAACMGQLPVSTVPAALPSVFGACLVVASVHGGASNALLGAPPVVAIGLVSYSLYLWHWPLLALFRATSIGEGGLAARLQLCVLALLLAGLSYHYVEQPFRRLSADRNRILAIGVAVSLLLATLALAVRSTIELPTANQPELRCHSAGHEPPMLKCPRNALTRAAIWGDSMAYAWTPIVGVEDENGVANTRDACGPFLGYLPQRASEPDRRCAEFNELVAAQVDGLRTLYLVARWNDEPARYVALERTLRRIAPRVKHVVIIGPTPELRDEPERCLKQGSINSCSIPRGEFDAHAAPILARLRALSTPHANVEVLDPGDYFCTLSNCPAFRHGRQLYWDSHHVASGAARDFAERRQHAQRRPGS